MTRLLPVKRKSCAASDRQVEHDARVSHRTEGSRSRNAVATHPRLSPETFTLLCDRDSEGNIVAEASDENLKSIGPLTSCG